MAEETAIEAPISAVELPADAPESFDSAEAATRYFLAQRKPAADGAEQATADDELSDEDNAAPREEATGEDEEAAPAETQPRELPRSWTKDQNERWAKLDPDMQDFLLEQDRKASEVVRRSQNEAAEKLKGLTAKEQQAEQARKDWLDKVPSLEDVKRFVAQGPFADIKSQDDADALAASDPFRYLQWDAYQKRLAGVAEQAKQAETLKANEKQTKRNTYRDEQRVQLNELVPDFSDPKKFSAAWERALPELEKIGLPRANLDRWSNTDVGHEILLSAGFQKLIADSQKLADLQAAKTALAAKPVPPVQRPGARPSGGNANNLQALTQTLSSSGSIDDAVALLVAQRASGQRRAS